MFDGMDRAERIGTWTSGLAHAGLIGWVAVAGALFRPLDTPAIRMTEVATMTETDFQAYAATARGSGPLSGDNTQISNLPAPAQDSTDPGAPDASAAPVTDAPLTERPALPPSEDAPDLSDLAPQAPVSVATELPQIAAPAETADTDPQIAALPPTEALRPDTPVTASRPDLPATDSGIRAPEAPLPRSALALNNSPRPQDRPGGLVAARNARIAAAAAAQQAAADAAAAAQAQAAADADAAAQRQADAAAQAQAEAAAQAEQDELAAAEAQAEALAEAIAAQRNDEALAEAREDEARQQAEAEAERQADIAAEAERQAEADRAAAEAAQTEADRLADAAAQAAADQAARDEQAVRDADAAAAVAAARTEPGGDELAMALDDALDVPGAGDTDGPPLSLSEKDGFRLAVEQCWNKGMLSVEAARTTVSIRFSMTPDGRPEDATMRLVGQSGGGDAAAQQAFDIARRAILRCQGNGYPLPMDKYNRWKEIVIDFRPDGASVN